MVAWECAGGYTDEGDRYRNEYGDDDVRFDSEDFEGVEAWELEQVSWERAMLDHVLASAGRDDARNEDRKRAMHAVDSTLRGLFDRMSSQGSVADTGALDAGIARATRRAGRAQREYDRQTVDSLVSMSKSMLRSGMYEELKPYEVQRLVNKINEGYRQSDGTTVTCYRQRVVVSCEPDPCCAIQ